MTGLNNGVSSVPELNIEPKLNLNHMDTIHLNLNQNTNIPIQWNSFEMSPAKISDIFGPQRVKF